MARSPLTATNPLHAFAAVAMLAALAGCAESPADRREIALESCRLPRLAVAAQCGSVPVPEDRTRPDARRIDIHVAVLPANTLSPRADPLLVLAGGPGQAASTLAPFGARLTELRRTRDVVLVDQRGTGRSSPLRCDAYSDAELEKAALETDPLPRATRCAQEIASQGVDAAQYTTAAFVADLEAVRVALGVPRWNLWGGSYGTRVALDYLRRHPDRVRTVVLDGVAPPDLKVSLDVWMTRERALAALFDRCRAAPACARALPDPGAALDRAIERHAGVDRTITFANPATGAIERVPASRDGVVALLQPLLYSPETASLIPSLIARAGAGDLAPLVAATGAFASNIAETMNTPLHYSVTCAEDVPRIRADERASAYASPRTGSLVRAVLAVCDVWPRGTPPADHAAAVESATPALILSGGLDPVTSPAYGETVARTLSNHRHIVAPGYGHIVSPHACGPRLISAFVDEAGFSTLPGDCVKLLEGSKAPALWTGLLGPDAP